MNYDTTKQPRNATITASCPILSHILHCDDEVQAKEGSRVYVSPCSDRNAQFVRVHMWTNEEKTKGFSGIVLAKFVSKDS
jgi:hypothetical protein